MAKAVTRFCLCILNFLSLSYPGCIGIFIFSQWEQIAASSAQTPLRIGGPSTGGYLEAANDLVSPFNGCKIDPRKKGEEYTFLVTGHLYGSASDQTSLLPASTLLRAITKINSLGARFFIALGDIFRIPEAKHIDNFLSNFALKLEMPFFNAVGNHDVLKYPEEYLEKFGTTFFSFTYNTDIFIILDSEKNYGQILGEQLRFFQDVLADIKKNKEIRNVFIFSHRPVWTTAHPAFGIIYTHRDKCNFNSDIKPLLLELPNLKKIYWFSDDTGGNHFVNFFFDNNIFKNITFIDTGIGDSLNDLILLVKVNNAGGVGFKLIPLGDQFLLPAEHYNLEYWKTMIKPIRYRSIFDKVMRRLRDSYFIIGFTLGVIAGAVLTLIGILIISRIKARRRG
ncbi:MAG: metallophosphoesterase [Candidatus Aminicenantes bacterium]|jgi:hypothetical protein